MMFSLPLAALVALSLIYRKDLGIKAILIYWGLWLLGYFACGKWQIPSCWFIAGEALLGVMMLLHIKKHA